MSLRQRLPRLGARLLRGLVAAEQSGTPALAPRAAVLLSSRLLSSAAGRALGCASSLPRASVLPQHSSLLGMASMRPFSAAADLPAHQVCSSFAHLLGGKFLLSSTKR